jgi:protein-serine/threonine kinase
MAINTAVTQENRKQTGRHHSRNRSISDFQPEQLQNVRQRHVTIGSGDAPSFEAAEYRMQREAYLAAQRGLTRDPDAPKQIPSPPPSNTSVAESDEPEEDTDTIALNADGEPAEYLQIHCGINNRKRKFRKLRQLGQGTFSKVVLATDERIVENPAPANIEEQLNPARLVAVKIVEHGPAGGADKERIDTSLRREVEMLKHISHPSLVHLKACEYQESRTLLVLTYCSGGDLFELASSQREVLTAPMVQRMFSEIVSAVRYLHTNWIVHRDIKLENVLVNFPSPKLAEISDPKAFPSPIVTLTDLGLSRRIPDPPESPLLTTRCGSEDYAAPEILLGQPYDGRHTDAWALGVLLYALMEGRLPFDCPPNKPERSRNTHRIARCDWIWCRFGDVDGEWDSSRGGAWEGARECVEGLLKKVRMGRRPLEDIEGLDWVRQGIDVPGGLQMREEDLDEMN